MSIQEFMQTSMENIRKMIDVNTVVGEAIVTGDGTMIIPVSRVSCGFGAGGGENRPVDTDKENAQPVLGGGSGGGISLQPVGFLVVQSGEVRMLPVDKRAIYDRLLDSFPQIVDTVSGLFQKEPENTWLVQS